MKHEELSAEGLATRRRVLGDEYVDRATQSDDLLSQGFQPLVTNYCWDQIWNDDSLSARERSLVVLSITAAMSRMEEFRLHTLGALNNGLTEPELLALLKHIAVYAGVPAGVSGLKVMREVIAELGAPGHRLREPDVGRISYLSGHPGSMRVWSDS